MGGLITFILLFALIFGCVRAFLYFKKNKKNLHRLKEKWKNRELLIGLIVLLFVIIIIPVVIAIGAAVIVYLLLITWIWAFAVLIADIFRYLKKNPLIRKWRILFYSLVIAGIGIGYCVSTDMDLVYTYSKKLKAGGFPFPLVLFEYEGADFPMPMDVQLLGIVLNILFFIAILESPLFAAAFLKKRLCAGRGEDHNRTP
jgi:hypothetical protein